LNALLQVFLHESHAGLVRSTERLTLFESGVPTAEQLATVGTIGHLPDLARALVNLGIELSQVGRKEQGIRSTRDAIEVYRQIADAEPLYRPSLAMALTNLAVQLIESGNRDDAITPAEEAVTICRESDGSDPTNLFHLASALLNL